MIWSVSLPIFLYVPFYFSEFSLRQSEHILALRKNLANKFIDRVYLIPEEAGVNNISLFSHEKLFFMNGGEHRQTLSSVFKIINANLMSEQIHIPMIANSDIYFDETLSVLRKIKHSREFICLTMLRHEVSVRDNKIVSTLHDRSDSQDAWIFGPMELPDKIGNYQFGKPGCDNVLLHELHAAGYCLLNVARMIIAHHIHLTLFRTYKEADRLHKPYLSLPIANFTVLENGTLSCKGV